MKLQLDGILWPSLGYPADVTPGKGGCFKVVAHLPKTLPTPASAQLLLTPVGGLSESAIDLNCSSLRSSSLDELTEFGNWSAWVRARAPRVTVFSFPIPHVSRLLRTRLYDLQLNVGSQVYTKPGAAFVRRAGQGDIGIGVATDIHVASRWDEIEKNLETFFPILGHRQLITPSDLLQFSSKDIFASGRVSDAFINPNRNFGRFLRIINHMASEGTIDALILSGDLVDFKFQQPRGFAGNDLQATEWDLFQRIVLGKTHLSDRLTVPLFTSTGNHDYRLYPYRLQVYGIRHCGIADEITREYLRRQNRLFKIKYRLSDLDAIRVNTGNEHSLNFYYRDVNAFDDYDTEIGSLRTVFLDSGPDASSDFSHLSSRRWRRYMKGVLNISEPQSNGLSGTQVRYLQRCMEQNDKRSMLIVTHAPLMIPKEGSSPVSETKQELELQVSLGPEPAMGDPKDDSLTFESQMSEEGLDVGSLMRNQLPCLRTLQRHHGITLMLSGHSHRHIEFSLDKQNGRIYRHWPLGKREFQKQEVLERAWMLQTPALGHVYIGDSHEGRPAFRLLRSTGGEIREVTVEKLCERPLDSWLYEWKAHRLDPNHEAFEIYFDPAPTQNIETGRVLHRLILQFTGEKSEQTKGQSRLQRISVVAPYEEVLATRTWDDASGEHLTALLFNDVRRVDLIVEGRPSGTTVAFVFESFLKHPDGFVSCGLRRHVRNLGP